MNFFGFNSAAINGAATTIISGAALISSIATATAQGTRIQLPESVAAASVVTAEARGTRVVNGGAEIVQTSNSSAFWTLLTLANAHASSSLVLKATATEAYGHSQSSSNASGYITQNAKATSYSQSNSSALPLVTIGYSTEIVSTSSMIADASVKLNGSTLWQRDGYIGRIATSLQMSAAPLRTAYSSAAATVTSSATSDSIKQHGGAATMSSSLIIIAQPSVDAVRVDVSFNMTALPTVTQSGQAQADCYSSFDVAPVCITQASDVSVSSHSDMSALGRHAVLGLATSAISSNFDVSARLAWLGTSSISCESSAEANGIVIVGGVVNMAAQTSSSAQFSVIRESSITMQASSSAYFMGSKNADLHAPDSRTMKMDADSVLMQIPYDDREMKVEA